MTKTDIWLLRTVTNLHAGSGDSDYGTVDKHVQRDAATNLPTINGSSMKGALREYFEVHQSGDTNYVFGTDNRKGKATDLQQGHYIFSSALLLGLPVRSSHALFYVATCPGLVRDFLEKAELSKVELSTELTAELKTLAALKPKDDNPIYLGKDFGRASGPGGGKSRLDKIFAPRRPGKELVFFLLCGPCFAFF